MCVLTIDTGTTNTRVRLWDNGSLRSEGFSATGVRDTATTGSTASLQAGVRSAIGQALSRSGLTEADIRLVVAAGMITSNMGLWELKHVPTPAGIDELAAGMQSALLPEITDHPIWFIPGVKSLPAALTLANCDAADMMRGEEVEIYGLSAQTGITGPAVFILPGSHTKFVQLDANSAIRSSATSIAGELLSVITQHTLIANALDKSFAKTLEPEPFLAGAKYGSSVGIGRACFQVRLLDLFTDMTVNQKANFALGAVLAGDLSVLEHSQSLSDEDLPLVIGGSGMIARGLELLLSRQRRSVRLIDDAKMRLASGLGCLAVARRRGLL